jgi:hypothetical protein
MNIFGTSHSSKLILVAKIRFGSIAVLRELSAPASVRPTCEVGLIVKYVGMVISGLLLFSFVLITFTQTKIYDMFHGLRMHAAISW